MRWTLPLTARFDWAALLAALAFGGAVSTVLGPHHGWDLKNYHVYNAHAFLTGRIGTDIAPAMIQTYHNPLIELPFYYLLLHFNEHPYLITFAMGLPYGVMVFLVFWLSREVFADPASPPGGADLVRVLGATAIGATGAATVSVVGTTNNDI